MNSLIRKSVTPFGALVVAALFLVAMIIISIASVTHAASKTDSKRGNLITIHDRGTEKAILSHAATIGDALKEVGINIDIKDVVEPAVDEKIIASDYQVNIYRARPVIIIDGSIRQKIMTPYQTAEQIVADVGIKLYSEDKTTISRVDDLTEGAGLQLTITRSTPFTFTLYGKTTTARTMGKTVGAMLTEKGIILTKDDRVLPSQDTVLSEGMAIRVWREGKQTITVDESIDFEVEKIKDVDREVGYKNVTTPGQQGLRSVSYEVVIQDGQEAGRTEIASLVTKQPTKQVEVIGARGEYTTPTENETITWNFLISNGFTKNQAAGIMGNLMQEHGFNTSDTSGGYGLVQWTGSRRAELLDQSYPENIYTQLNYLMHELNTNYASVKNNILGSNTIDAAVTIFQNQFERCGRCMEDNRIQFAYDIYATFSSY